VQSLSASERSFKLLASSPKMFSLKKHRFIGMIGNEKLKTKVKVGAKR
jgi:hypothetical protein